MSREYHPLESDRSLIVYIDFKSPYAYLAVEPTRRMLNELGLSADWRPFVLDIPSYLGTAKLDKAGKVAKQNRSEEQWSGVKYAYYDCRRYANLRDLTVRGTVKIWNTDLPALGMQWAKQHSEAAMHRFIDLVYVPFWKRELDAESLSAIEALLASAGVPTAGFAVYVDGVGGQAHRDQQEAAFAAGVYGVPTFVVARGSGEAPAIYFGREHLPRIRWHLGGEQGPAPDVAYDLPAKIDLELAAAQGKSPALAATLEVFVDFNSPASYLAVAPTIAMAERLGVDLIWHPLATPPLKTLSKPSLNDDRSILHRRRRGHYIATDLARYAAHPLADLYTPFDTQFAAAGLVWVQHTRPSAASAYVQTVMARYWQQQQSIASTDSIVALIDALGLDGEAWRQAFEQRAATTLSTAIPPSIKQTPMYRLGEEILQGRQHLPLIEARLLGVAPLQS